MLSAEQMAVFSAPTITSKTFGCIRIGIVPIYQFYLDAAINDLVQRLGTYFAAKNQFPQHVQVQFCYLSVKYVRDLMKLRLEAQQERNIAQTNGFLELRQSAILGYQLTTRDINQMNDTANSFIKGQTKQMQISFQNDYSVPVVVEVAKGRSLNKGTFLKDLAYCSDAVTFEEAAIADFWPGQQMLDGLIGVASVDYLDAAGLQRIIAQFDGLTYEDEGVVGDLERLRLPSRVCVIARESVVETCTTEDICAQANKLITDILFELGKDANNANKSIKSIRSGKPERIQLTPQQNVYFLSDFWFPLNRYQQFQQFYVPSVTGKHYLKHPQITGLETAKSHIFIEFERVFYCEHRYMSVRVQQLRVAFISGISHMKFGMLDEAMQLFEFALLIARQGSPEMVLPLLCYEIAVMDYLQKPDDAIAQKTQDAMAALEPCLQSGFSRICVDTLCYFIYLARKFSKVHTNLPIYTLMQKLHLYSRFLQPGIGNNKQVFSTLQQLDDYIHYSMSVQMFYALKLQYSRYIMQGKFGLGRISQYAQNMVRFIADSLSQKGVMPMQLCQMLCGHYSFAQTLILSQLDLLNLFENYYFIKHGFYIPFVQHSMQLAAPSDQQASPIISRVSKLVASPERSLSFVFYEVDQPIISFRPTELTKFIYFKFQRPVLVVQQPISSFCNSIEQQITFNTTSQRRVDILANRLFDLKLCFPLLYPGSGFYEQLSVLQIQLSQGYQMYILYQSFDALSRAIYLRCELSRLSTIDGTAEIHVESVLARLGNIQLYIPIKKQLFVLGSYCFPVLESVQIVNHSFFMKRHRIEHAAEEQYYFCYKMQFQYCGISQFHLNTDSVFQAYFTQQPQDGYPAPPTSPKCSQQMRYCDLHNDISAPVMYILTKQQPSERPLRYMYSFSAGGVKIQAECVIFGELYQQRANFSRAFVVLDGGFYDSSNLHVTNSENQLIASKFKCVKQHRVFLQSGDTANLTLAHGKEYTSDAQSQLHAGSYSVRKAADGVFEIRFIGDREQFRAYTITELSVVPFDCYAIDEIDIFGAFRMQCDSRHGLLQISLRFAESEFRSAFQIEMHK